MSTFRSPPCKRQRLSNGLSPRPVANRNSGLYHNFPNSNSGNVNAKVDIKSQKQALPIFPVRWKLIQEIRKHNTVIVIGETGSGKTTQIPQYLFAASLQRLGIIGITQPRRVAAVTIASRVAKEMSSKIGETVGYCVRFEDVTSVNTKMKVPRAYMTDGMLLREAILDPLLRRYSIIILDEAHERTVHTDVLFGVVKKAQAERKLKTGNTLKIIIMSATMDVDHFSSYFNNAPVLYLEGRQHPVQIMYAKEKQEDYLFAALVTIFQIHQSAPPRQDILVFLTGQEEIESLARTSRDIAKGLSSDCPQMKVFPLYAALPSNAQLNIFNPTPKGCRKVILSTNLAETSITIPGIKFVIDTGMVKSRCYNANCGLDMLKVQRVSKAQAWQRTGRAGRESSGMCYRTYLESEFESFRDFTIPEIQRRNLAGVVLQMMAIGINNVVDFDFMDKPSAEHFAGAFDVLQLLGAIHKQENFQLTPLGKQMSILPVDPQLAKMLLVSKELNCSEEILSIISLLSVESVMITPQAKREEAMAVRRKFISSEGDHITLLNIFNGFKGSFQNKQWCQENFVHHRNLQMANNIRNQLIEFCTRLDISPQSCGQNMEAIRKCLVYGLFMNSAELLNGTYITFDSRQAVHIHPSSCLFYTKPSYIIFTELVHTTKCYMRNISVVEPYWLLDAAPTFFKKGQFGMN